jgi:hypothetical protein
VASFDEEGSGVFEKVTIQVRSVICRSPRGVFVLSTVTLG